MKTEIIKSLHELQLRMPAIIKQYGNDNSLTHIALANPIIALERTGLKFTEEAKEEIEAHARFGKDDAKTYNHLKERIYTAAGGRFDLKNPGHVADIILRLGHGNDQLKEQETETKKSGYQGNKLNREKLLAALNTIPKKVGGKWQDSLSAFVSFHPIVSLIIEYRQMEVERPGFANPDEISTIEERLRKSPFKNVVFSLKRDNIENPR